MSTCKRPYQSQAVSKNIRSINGVSGLKLITARHFFYKHNLQNKNKYILFFDLRDWHHPLLLLAKWFLNTKFSLKNKRIISAIFLSHTIPRQGILRPVFGAKKLCQETQLTPSSTSIIIFDDQNFQFLFLCVFIVFFRDQ